MTSSSASLDIFEVFGDTISSLRSRQHRVIESIWAYEIENEDLDNAEGEIGRRQSNCARLKVKSAVEIKALSRWLAPQDRVIATLSRDHTTFSDSQAEFTCLWFQKPLTRFIQSNNTVFLITGQPGSGKTVLAGSIVERLQRPVGRKSFDTISCFISKY
jgi:DNA replication protein DnaC